MVSGMKLQIIHCSSLEGHSFVCVTVIGLKFALVYSRDTSVQYKCMYSLWLKGWREINLMKNQGHRKCWVCVWIFVCIWIFVCFQYTLERYCVCVHLFFIMMSFPSLFYLYDTVAMGLCDVKCKFLPRSSVFQEGTCN